MAGLLTSAQMRAVEAEAMASGRVTGLELMERAGRGVVEAIFEEWPELRAGTFRAAVLCGPGNNGGDGFVVARLLKEWGWEVTVFLYGDPERMPPDARVNYERWLGMGEVAGLSELCQGDPERADFMPRLVVDALFGTGLTRPLEAKLLQGQLWLSYWRDMFGGLVPWVAVDVPSGVHGDTGEILGGGEGLAPDCVATVTFFRPKPGHCLLPGRLKCGELVVAGGDFFGGDGRDVGHRAYNPLIWCGGQFTL